MGLALFELALALQKKYCKPGMTIHNTIQTNATQLDDDWAAFFKQHNMLVGVSLDGPRELHNIYRVDKGGKPSFDAVMQGIAILKKHAVDFNILTTLHAGNATQPLDVYRFLRDEVGTQFMQFIPIVERDNQTGFQEGQHIRPRSVTAKQYGHFLITVFDEWVRYDVGRVFVQIFDVALAAWLGMRPGLCIFEETCGTALAMEHNGDVFSCDHYVEPAHKLGNMLEIPLIELVASEQQRRFGEAKRDILPRMCRECRVRFVCNGGCPKDRVLHTPDGEPGLNYLCEGYLQFFTHIDQPMRYMVNELGKQRAPANIMQAMAQADAELHKRYARTGRNEPCPCGSGKKYKHCHG